MTKKGVNMGDIPLNRELSRVFENLPESSRIGKKVVQELSRPNPNGNGEDWGSLFSQLQQKSWSFSWEGARCGVIG